MSNSDKRLAHLDGLRGVAVLFVVFFHYFERWPAFYPYGTTLVTPLSMLTALTGVCLFFVISGFVITMTLHRCASLAEFAVRRFGRLWPPMLLCALISYSLLSTIPASPFHVLPRDFLPSLTFIDPYIYGLALHQHFDWMDGAYWSLFVEVQFYAFISLIYFLSRKHFTRNFVLTSAALMLVCICASIFGIRSLGTAIGTSQLPEYLAFFAIGVGFYRLHIGESALAYFAVGLVGLVVQPGVSGHTGKAVMAIVGVLVLAIAWLGIRTALGRHLLSARWITAIGVASYSLYLLHQRIGVALIHLMGERMRLHGPIALVLAPVVALVLIGVSMAVYRYWEAPLNRLIVKRMSPTPRPYKEAPAPT
jgi:peptidoglycan/LPS O-acetylase OafA/YrhL